MRQVPTFDKFEADLELARKAFKHGDEKRGLEHLSRAISRAEFDLEGEERKEARARYQSVGADFYEKDESVKTAGVMR